MPAQLSEKQKLKNLKDIYVISNKTTLLILPNDTVAAVVSAVALLIERERVSDVLKPRT